MHRFYPIQNDAGLFQLTEEDVHHARNVLRLKPGDIIEIANRGLRFQAALQKDGLLEIISPLPSTEPNLRITLFQGLPKGDKMDWIVQKAVEVGVSSIVPVRMERCVVQLRQEDERKKQTRWQRIAREAGKQSGRCLLPEVSLPVSVNDLPDLVRSMDAALVPWEETSAIGPKAWYSTHTDVRSLGILIGPEGGISSGEIEMIRESFQPITLGPRIFRTETAGLAASAAILALFGEME